MFRLVKKSRISKARLGVLETAHGRVRTPFFMPVGTQGAVKHASTGELKALKAQILLANTYHLMLRPGADRVRRLGGLHAFMNWDKPILTDSGGFQVFSLSGSKRGGDNLVKISEKGVEFRSYVDGSKHFLSPQKAVQIQSKLGVDIAVCLDVCPALPAGKKALEKAVELTGLWAGASRRYHHRIKGDKPLLFGVIQGGLDPGLRQKSLEELADIGFDGYNIGGLSVGESPGEMYRVLRDLTPRMPADKPRYLMGVGYPENIVEAARQGVDMFDCVIPTREGRHGRLFAWQQKKLLDDFYQKIDITKSRHRNNKNPINENSRLPELREYSLAYLHYLFRIREPLGQRLAALNNLEFYLDLMDLVRKGIRSGRL